MRWFPSMVGSLSLSNEAQMSHVQAYTKLLVYAPLVWNIGVILPPSSLLGDQLMPNDEHVLQMGLNQNS